MHVMQDQKKKKDNQSIDEELLDLTLRPSRFSEFTGQTAILKNLNVALEAAKSRKESLEHLLLYGPPGLGKTTLAHIIAREMGVNIRVTSGPAIERTGDLASILTGLEPSDVLFIDEIHRLNRVVEEMLYPAMEDFVLDIVLGKGPSARTVRLDVPRFTLIGATTRIGMLSSPMRDRFGLVHRLEFYSDEELLKILTRSAKVLGVSLVSGAARELARRSRGTPRIANRLLRRVRDMAQVKGSPDVVEDIVAETLAMMEIDDMGLDKPDRAIVETIIEKYGGGPVGIETIAVSIHEDIETIEDVHEPYLIQLGFLKRTPRGRVATKRAYEHLGVAYPEERKEEENRDNERMRKRQGKGQNSQQSLI